ncbi:MAG TPA: dihydroneopterin aldolase [Deinococcales bacterium]|nr:dihydroneopterin aldolase [Deinococcales bacterium]
MTGDTDRIVLEGLEFFGRHGVYAEEGRLGARFVVDLELFLNLAGIADRVDDTVDYGLVYASVRDAVTGARFYLIEALANHIAATLLAEHPRLAGLTVRVHKPHAPLPGVFRDVFAEVHRDRA